MKKVLSLLLAVMMVVSLCPITALADGELLELQPLAEQEEQLDEQEEQPAEQEENKLNTLVLGSEAAPLAEGDSQNQFKIISTHVNVGSLNELTGIDQYGNGATYKLDPTTNTGVTNYFSSSTSQYPNSTYGTIRTYGIRNYNEVVEKTGRTLTAIRINGYEVTLDRILNSHDVREDLTDLALSSKEIPAIVSGDFLLRIRNLNGKTLICYYIGSRANTTNHLDYVIVNDDIHVEFVWNEVTDDPAYTVTAVSADEATGTANAAFTGNAEGKAKYSLTAAAAENYSFDHWEKKAADADDSAYVTDEDATSQGAAAAVAVSENTVYRAVFVLTSAKKVDFVGSEMGIQEMIYAREPGKRMWNNYPGTAPSLPTVGSGQCFLTDSGTLAAGVNPASVQTVSKSVKAGVGASLSFSFQYVSELTNPTVKLYAGQNTDEANLIATVTKETLGMGSGVSSGYGLCTVPVMSMPYTDKVTVVFAADGRETAQKTFTLKEAMTPRSDAEERTTAIQAVYAKYNELVEGLKNASITYQYSSAYLMIREELGNAFSKINNAEAGKVAEAKVAAVALLEDTAKGIFHSGVDAGITVKDSMRVVRVPVSACIFDAMCAALEQAYPDGHWYYSVGGSAFGVYFNGAGYLEDNTNRPGVRYDGGPVAGGYGVTDYYGSRSTGMANGVSNQCVWEGICTGTPNSFSSAGSPDTPIVLNRNNKNAVTWDLARLLQHYSAAELKANSVYSAALASQANDADDKLDKALRVEYVDFFLSGETEATRAVVKAIAKLTTESTREELNKVQADYEALTEQEKNGVINYDELLLLMKTGDELAAAKIDMKIGEIGTVEYTEECSEKITEARKAYDEASSTVKGMVTKLPVLEAAEAALAELSAEKKAAVKAAADKLPAQVSYPDDGEALIAAEEAWDALLKADQESSDMAETKTKIENARKAYDKSKADYYAKRLDGAMERVLAYLDKTVTSPKVDSISGEWAVLAQARGDMDKAAYYENYYQTVVKYVKGIGSGKLSTQKSTDNSRVILALTSIDKDITNVGGYDLLAPYADFDWVTKQGINGTIFALIALDCGKYEIPATQPEANQTTRDKLIARILDSELTDGGFTFGGKQADVDITAMALQALAPYKDRKDVADAIERALTVLSSMQGKDGGFGSAAGEVNVESTAQVAIALFTLGIDPTADARFIKGSSNLFTAMLPYQLENGSFERALNGGTNQMTTEQAALALVAYERFQAKKTPLYQISSDSQEKLKAKAVDELVNKLAPVTLESEDAIKEAREAFDALTPKQKEFLDKDTESKLVSAENEYKRLVKEDADKKAAKEVEEKIAALQPVTKDSGEAIKDARSSYEALTPEQKELVSKDSVAALEKAEKAYGMIVDSNKPDASDKGDKTGSIIKISATGAAKGEENPNTGAPAMSIAPAMLMLAAAVLVLKKRG